MGAFSSSSPLIFRHIFRPAPPTPQSSILSLFLTKQTTTLHTFLTPFSPHPFPFSHSLSSSSPSLSISSPNPHSLSYVTSETTTRTPVTDKDSESENEEFESEKETVSERSEKVSNSSPLNTYREFVSKLPSLSVKEKKELASYAHSLGKKLKSQQVGKSGVTDAVSTALIETLESNELLKLKIHGNCPGELDDVVKQLEETTGSVVVGRIGRTVILYRPSLTKLKAEEKKRQAVRIFVKKQQAFRSSLQNKRQTSGLSRLGDRRGKSRT